MDTILNHMEASLPKKYRPNSHTLNKETNLPKLFRGIMLGPSGSGKTNLLFDFLKRSPNVYTHLHLIARQPDQPLYDYLKDELQGFMTIYSEDNVPRPDDIKKNGLQLVVFDDWSNDIKWCQKHVVPFYIRGRHKGLATLFLAHAYHTGVPKMVRLNSEVLMILRSPSKKDLLSVLADMPIASVTREDLWRWYSDVSRDKGQMLLIDSTSQQIRRNWKQILN